MTTNSSPASPRPVYSFDWSRNIYDQFHQKYARATEEALDILGVSPRQLITMIATPCSNWPYFRDFVKYIDKANTLGETSPEKYRLLTMWGARMSEKSKYMSEKSIDYAKKALHTKGAGEEVGRVPEVATAAEGTQPSLRNLVLFWGIDDRFPACSEELTYQAKPRAALG